MSIWLCICHLKIAAYLANVDSSNEEGSLHIVFLELIKYIIGVDVWSVIVCDSHGTGHYARVDSFTTVLNRAELWARNIDGGLAVGDGEGITASSKIDLTVLEKDQFREDAERDTTQAKMEMGRNNKGLIAGADVPELRSNRCPCHTLS